MNYKDIEKKVLNKITPTQKDRRKLDETVDELEKKIQTESKKKGLDVKIELVGSVAKDTYLKNNLDIDYFLIYPRKYNEKEITTHSISIGEKILQNTEQSYAEHPYIRGIFNNYKTEIVPCYKIEDASQKITAVDRTPLHTKYVQQNLKEKQKTEVRLLKQFLMGIKCYGAEAEIEGFSGYLCEILIIKYGNFRELLKNSQKWKKREKISIQKNKFPNFDNPLVFIDPVDKNRNVASALSPKKFNFFIKASQRYLKQPSIKFFFPNPVKPWPLIRIKKKIQTQNKKYIGIKFDKPDIISENLYPQIRKATRSIWKASERQGFKIYDITYYIDDKNDNIYIIIKTDKKPLSQTLIHTGPPIRLKDNTKEFIKKWKHNNKVTQGPYKKNGRIYVEIPRDYTDIKKFLKNNIKNLSMGKYLDKKIKEGFYFLELKDLLKNNLQVFWTKYLDNKMPWER